MKAGVNETRPGGNPRLDHQHAAFRTQHAPSLGKKGLRLWYVVHDIGHNDGTQSTVGKRKPLGIKYHPYPGTMKYFGCNCSRIELSKEARPRPELEYTTVPVR